ncbi:MAG: FAD-dependent oxidoreductase [Coriobacteriales bacterium]|nr:FAD-dependent oxidoreductase [Coriobacteriales bacterium]
MGTRTFAFERPGEFEYRPGQFFFVLLPITGRERHLEHHFTLSSSPTEANLECTTRLTGRDFKDHLDRLEPGAVVRVGGPAGDFVPTSDMRKVAYVCGGIGITPARSALRWARDTNADIDITVLYSNRDLASTAFREEIEGLDSPPIRVVLTLTEPEAEWTGPKGRIDADVIREHIPDWEERHFFVSGPPPMVEAMVTMLTESVGVARQKLRREEFLGYER